MHRNLISLRRKCPVRVIHGRWLLYTVYVYLFEIASVILTVAIVAAITLTLREHKRKLQDPGKQVAVRREDRVRLVNMPSSKTDKEEDAS